MMQKVVTPPSVTTMLKGSAQLTHSKCMSVIIAPTAGYSDYVTMARSYGMLKPEVGKGDVCLQHNNAKSINIPKQTAVGEIKAANAILALLWPNQTENEFVGVEATAQKNQMEGQREILNNIDLMGSQDWSLEDQKEMWDLILESASIFVLHDMILGKISLRKHSIRLIDNTLFKECYRDIPLDMYQEVCNHLKEMLEIGAIHLFHSPWASPVILVLKKDGKLQFCIDF